MHEMIELHYTGCLLKKKTFKSVTKKKNLLGKSPKREQDEQKYPNKKRGGGGFVSDLGGFFLVTALYLCKFDFSWGTHSLGVTRIPIEGVVLNVRPAGRIFPQESSKIF